jgi:hypothetical protein
VVVNSTLPNREVQEPGQPGADPGAGSGVVKLVTDGLGYQPDIEHQFSLWREATQLLLQLVEMRRNSDHSGGNTGLFLSRRNEMRAFIKRFLMHYGIYRRYPLGWFPALRNAWRAAQP